MTKKQTNQSKNKSRRGEGGNRSNYLVGKVVLLIGNDTAVLHTLIKRLAQKGADIALVCRELSSEAIRRVKESVESLGRRFLLVDETNYQTFSADRLIDTVTSTLGHLDVFIDLSADLSAQQEALLPLGNGQIHREILPVWMLRQPILEELATVS